MLEYKLTYLLANVYAFSIRLQSYHWNVEGINFKEYHELFGDMYEDVSGSIDTIAELIRTLDKYVPASLSHFSSLTEIKESETYSNGLEAVTSASGDNSKVLISLLEAYEAAEKEGEIGISNFLQDRIQAHEKHKWFLNSIQK
jgi:starvation-inducible DNA-binding protein